MEQICGMNLIEIIKKGTIKIRYEYYINHERADKCCILFGTKEGKDLIQ